MRRYAVSAQGGVRGSVVLALVVLGAACSESTTDPDPDPSQPTAQSLSVEVTGDGEGRVSSSPAGIDCRTGGTGTCQAEYDAGTQVTLTAAPDAGFAFGGWAGASTDPAHSVTMDRARTVSASFIVPPPAELHVPGDFATIGEAIDAAADGDHVVLAPGSYVGTFDFAGKGITLRSTDPEDYDVVAATILDGDGEGPVLTIAYGEAGASVQGLTIRNGRAERGGGLYVAGTYPVIAHNVFENNVATVAGGGAAAIGRPAASQGTIGHRGPGQILPSHEIAAGFYMNEFTGNRSEGDGGGLFFQGASMEAHDNVFRGNTARRSGGGARVEPDPDATEADLAEGFLRWVNNVFEENEAEEEDGGGLSLGGMGGEVDFEGGAFIRNIAGRDGGGVHGASVMRLHITFTGVPTGLTLDFLENRAGRDGGGAFFMNDAWRTNENHTFNIGLRWDIFDDNRAERDGGGAALRGPFEAEFQGGSAAGNTAGRYGGAVSARPNPEASEAELAASFLRLLEGEFRENVSGADGGALYAAEQGRVQVVGPTFTGNAAAYEGGGLWISVGPQSAGVELSDVTVRENQAGMFGGGVYIGALMDPGPSPAGLEWTLGGTNVWEHNLAENGSALFLRGPGIDTDTLGLGLLTIFHMTGTSTFSNNIASDASGATVTTEGDVAFQDAEEHVDIRPVGENHFFDNTPRNFFTFSPYVRWAYTLADDVFAYPPDAVLMRRFNRPIQGSATRLAPFSFIEHGRVAGPEDHPHPDIGCSHYHLHGGPQGINFWGYRGEETAPAAHGPYTDLATESCGYGLVFGGDYGEEPPPDND